MKNVLVNFFGRLLFYLSYVKQGYISNRYRKRYDVDQTFIFNGDGILIYGDGKINLGSHSYIGRNSILQASDHAMIKVGKNCKIGPFFSAWTHSSQVDHDFNFDDKIAPKVGDIIIEDAVWIGANVVINPGVTIGENSIVGANSVVTKDVPKYGIVGGVPARLIRFKNINPSA